MVEITEFKNTAACFATGVCICVAENLESEFIGATINSFVSLSLDPCLILFSLKKASRFHAILLGKEHFTLNVLSHSQKDTALHFAKYASTPIPDAKLLIKASQSIPFVADCCANLYCKLSHTYDGGDHTIVIGQVEHVVHTQLPPLVYHMRNFHSLEPSPL